MRRRTYYRAISCASGACKSSIGPQADTGYITHGITDALARIYIMRLKFETWLLVGFVDKSVEVLMCKGYQTRIPNFLLVNRLKRKIDRLQICLVGECRFLEAINNTLLR